MNFPLTTPDTIYPAHPVEIARRLGFCLGNAVLCTLYAPYRDGVEDCDRTLEYLILENSLPQAPLCHAAFMNVDCACEQVMLFLTEADGDALWQDLSRWQGRFLGGLRQYLQWLGGNDDTRIPLERMMRAVRELRRVLSLRDTTGQIYQGMTGMPEEENV